MQVTKTTDNILVSGITLYGIKQEPAKSFQTFKKLNKHNWGLDGLSKEEVDKRVGQICVIYANRKKELRESTGDKAIKLIKNAAMYQDIKVEEKLDAKSKKHVVIKLAQKETRMPKVGVEAMERLAKAEADKRAKEQAARIEALEASLAAYKAKDAKGTKGTKEAAMLPEFA